MKISIDQKPLASALQIVHRAISSGSSHPILSGILLTAQEGILHLSATDLETSIECIISARVEVPGSIVLPGRELVEMANRIPSGSIEIAAPEDRHQAIVTWRVSEYVLNGYPPDQFPSLPTADEATSFSIPARVINDALRRTAFAAASVDAMPIICGVRLKFEEENLKATGTDGFRIAVWERGVPCNEELDVVLPKEGISDLLRILTTAEAGEDVSISLSENHVFFDLDSGTRFSTIVLEGKYPDVISMVSSPGGYTTELIVSKAEFVSACERAALLSNDNKGVRAVRLHVMDDRVVFKASSSELGEAYDEIEGEVTGEPLDILFQSRYLLEGIKNIDSDEISISFSDSEGAALMVGLNDEDYSYIALPMKQKS